MYKKTDKYHRSSIERIIIIQKYQHDRLFLHNIFKTSLGILLSR